MKLCDERPFETWHPIPSYYLEGYEVSNHGRVRKPVKRKNYYKTEWYLASVIKCGSVRCICRMRDGVRKSISLAKIVCAVFNGFPKEYRGEELVENINTFAFMRDLDLKNPYVPENLFWGNFSMEKKVEKTPQETFEEIKVKSSELLLTQSNRLEIKTVWRPMPTTFL